jgi:hypothetical protein
MKALKVLKKISRVIDVLGGNLAAGRQLRAKPTTVSNWRVYGRIPYRMYFPVRDALEPFGYTVRPSICGLTQPIIHKRKKKPKPLPVTTSRQGSKNGGANGRNGKRHKIRKRSTAMVGRTDQNTRGTMGDLDGQPDRQASGDAA